MFLPRCLAEWLRPRVLTLRTAKAHVSNILSKLQLASRSEAALFYEPPEPET